MHIFQHQNQADTVRGGCMFWGKALRYTPKKKMEFSKIIYILNLSFVVIVTGLSFLCVIKSGEWNIIDLSPISVVLTSAFASLSVSSLFYYRKAQAENVLKISKQIQNENIEVQNVEVANQVMNSDFGSNM